MLDNIKFHLLLYNKQVIFYSFFKKNGPSFLNSFTFLSHSNFLLYFSLFLIVVEPAYQVNAPDIIYFILCYLKIPSKGSKANNTYFSQLQVSHTCLSFYVFWQKKQK